MSAAVTAAFVLWVLAAVCVAWTYISLQLITPPTFTIPWYIKVSEVLSLVWLPATLLGAGVASAFALKSK